MTERKPSTLSVPDWVEIQIRQAEAAGVFENLPGSGKPLPGLDRPRHELAWVADYLRREGVDAAALLPPGLALAKEVEQLPIRLLAERREQDVRAVVEKLNRRIARAHAAPQTGPPLRVGSLDVERVVEEWRHNRDEIEARRATAAAARESAPEPPRRRSRLPWRRR